MVHKFPGTHEMLPPVAIAGDRLSKFMDELCSILRAAENPDDDRSRGCRVKGGLLEVGISAVTRALQRTVPDTTSDAATRHTKEPLHLAPQATSNALLPPPPPSSPKQQQHHHQPRGRILLVVACADVAPRSSLTGHLASLASVRNLPLLLLSSSPSESSSASRLGALLGLRSATAIAIREGHEDLEIFVAKILKERFPH